MAEHEGSRSVPLNLRRLFRSHNALLLLGIILFADAVVRTPWPCWRYTPPCLPYELGPSEADS
jgi:hypothetical protein